MAKKLSRLEFIEQCKQKHNNKYDYSFITDDVYTNADSKYKIICPMHGEFIQSGQVHKKGFGCQECSGKKKYDYNSLIKKFKEVHGDTYDYSKFIFSRMNSKIKIICKEHGEFLQHPKNHLSGQGCPKCAGIKPYTFDEFVSECNIIHNNKYDYSKAKDQFKTLSTSKITIICPVHGEFQQNAKIHKNGHGCKKCSDVYSYTTEEAIEQFKKVHQDTYDYSKFIYKNANTKGIIICTEHGEFLQKPSAHKNGQGCPKCGQEITNNKLRMPLEKFIERANIVHNNKYDYSKTTYNTYKVKIICSEHVEFEQNPGNHLAGHGCPRCAVENRPANFGFISSQEIKIRQFLDSIGIQYITNDKQKIFPKELDIYIPEYNFAIEVNGIYWHSDKFKDEKYHINKLTDCENSGIQLLQFYDTEIDNKFDIVTSMIRNKLGKTENKIFARKCEIRQVNKKDAKEFQEKNHIQGYIPSSIELGLFYNDELVLLTTFGKPRFNKNYEYELLRLCTKQNYSVAGGFSKILKHFKQTYSSSIISYACRKYSIGNVYEKTGFDFIENSKPSYVYTKDNIILSRYQCQKHKLKNLLGNEFDSNLSEKENMIKAGYHKVFDCGNKVYAI